MEGVEVGEGEPGEGVLQAAVEVDEVFDGASVEPGGEGEAGFEEVGVGLDGPADGRPAAGGEGEEVAVGVGWWGAGEGAGASEIVEGGLGGRGALEEVEARAEGGREGVEEGVEALGAWEVAEILARVAEVEDSGEAGLHGEGCAVCGEVVEALVVGGVHGSVAEEAGEVGGVGGGQGEEGALGCALEVALEGEEEAVPEGGGGEEVVEARGEPLAEVVALGQLGVEGGVEEEAVEEEVCVGAGALAEALEGGVEGLGSLGELDAGEVFEDVGCVVEGAEGVLEGGGCGGEARRRRGGAGEEEEEEEGGSGAASSGGRCGIRG